MYTFGRCDVEAYLLISGFELGSQAPGYALAVNLLVSRMIECSADAGGGWYTEAGGDGGSCRERSV